LLSWNVNSFRTAMNKGLLELINSQEYDVLMFQEVKTSQAPLGLPYKVFLNPGKKKGYSGVMTLTRVEPISVSYGMGIPEFDDEGRMITTEFHEFNVINVYFPNAGENLKRLEFKLKFDEAFEDYLSSLSKPSVICGDFNVAHEEIDIARPKDNVNHAGFTPQEREWFHKIIGKGFVDTYRMFVSEGGHYSWWSYRFHAREKNIGWRIDYCLVDGRLKDRVKKADILEKVTGSDHAPVTLDIG